MNPPFRLDGVFTVLPTAFRDDGALDLHGTAALARAAVDAKVGGLTVLGVMGEAAELTEDERREIVGCVRAATTLPLVVGVSGDSEGAVATRARDAAATGVAGLMVGPSRSVALSSAVAAAAAAGLPIVIQDYPAGSGVTVTVAELAEVAAHQPLVVGVKAEAPPTSGRIASLRSSNPTLGLLGGLGGLFLIDELRAGADGVMTGFALPERLVWIVDTYRTDVAAATAAWEQLLPLMRLEAFQPLSLAARKEVWRLRGVIDSSYCRRPGASLDERARADVRRALERVTG
ncbi:MAG: dihydrodipicolinate synthase family protein [Chloroflexota bacterium]